MHLPRISVACPVRKHRLVRFAKLLPSIGFNLKLQSPPLLTLLDILSPKLTFAQQPCVTALAWLDMFKTWLWSISMVVGSHSGTYL